jgi:hypothetical protein
VNEKNRKNSKTYFPIKEIEEEKNQNEDSRDKSIKKI